MRLLKAIAKALAMTLGTIVFVSLITFLTKWLNLDGTSVLDTIMFIGVLVFLTGLFYIDTDK